MMPLSPMRFGLLGPSNGDLSTLEMGASFLLFEQQAELVMYLGVDDALDQLVLGWARRLVGDDPTDAGIWDRAAACSGAAPREIEQFVESERKRQRLKALQCLPGAAALTIEILEGRVAVLLYDKALLDEEDILPASLLIFGKNQDPLVRTVGARTFISPGEIGSGPAGVALLRDVPSGEIELGIFSPDGRKLESYVVASGPKTGKLRVLDKTSSERP
jgi:hypothetical protein